MNLFRSMLLLFASLLPSVTTLGGDWPGFRGPHGNGISSESGFPTHWSPDENIKWRIPLPEKGNGSPIVVGEKIFLLYAEDDGKKRSTLCFDRKDGSELWKQTVEYSKVEETHKTNPYCPSTPASDGKHVYVWHRSAGMHCYDLDGNLVWSRDLGEFRHIWGGGSSPLLYEDLVIQLCGPGEKTFLVAFEKKTGVTRWQSELEPGGSASDKGRYIGSWATPAIVNVEGQDQILCPYPTRVVSYYPKTGEVISYCTGLEREKSDLCYTSPMVGDDIAVILGGFMGPSFGLQLGGTGNSTESHRLWRVEKRNPQRIGSGVVLDGYLYMANADGPGSIECIDVKSGVPTWVHKRSEDGPHWGSVVFANGTLYATGQLGTTTVFKPNPEKFEVVSINKLNEDCNSTPALSNGELFIRTWDALYCVSGGK